MANKRKMKNPGAEDNAAIETVPPEVQAELDANNPEARDEMGNLTGNGVEQGGFAPGTLEHIHSQSNGGNGADVPDEVTELQAAGVNVDPAEQAKAAKRSKNDFLKKVDEIGRAYGAGKTSMIVFAERITEAAAGKQVGPGDAKDVYSRFRKSAEGKMTIDDVGLVPEAATDEAKIASEAQQVSKIKKFIVLGNAMEWEGVDVIRRARNIHLDLLKASNGDRKGIMKGSTYTVLVSVAKEQAEKARAGVPMTDDELRSHMSVEVADKDGPTGADKLLDALKSLTQARNGANTQNNYRAPIDNVNVDDAIESVRAALGQIDQPKLDEYDNDVAEAEARKAEAAAKKVEREKAKAEQAAQAAVAGKAVPPQQGAAQQA